MKFNKIQINLKDYKKLNIQDSSKVEINRTNKTIEKFTFSAHSDLQDCEISEINKLGATWRDVYRVRFNLSGDFEPGDSIGILCPNKDEYAEKMLEFLNLKDEAYEIQRDGKNAFDFKGRLFDFFKYVYDFTGLPKKSTLMRLSKGNKYLEYLSSREGSVDYFGMIKNWNNILDVICMFGCKPTLEDVISGCEILKPRYYSLINKKDENYEILAGVISKEVQMYNTNSRNDYSSSDYSNGDYSNGDYSSSYACGTETRYGHFSQFIKNPNGFIKICHRPSKLMRLNNSKKALIICTGTGLAPFLSFLKNKQTDQKFWVIYGFRNLEDDLFEGVYENTVVDKILSSQGAHVTDFLKLNSTKIKEYTEKDCSVYVCGRMDMQKEVFRIFVAEFNTVVEEKRLFFDSWQ
ncbi:Sulfite reductase [NADPH] flavoprotein alpha-component [Nosema granulosis]|uniref:Sulfite reductase [NADPH] flavoprotein alpha-component n=1 Tax=Nosema granulosis TaxID=83296 RepID=A0A9P6H1F0_9MICR|nr:Sulfite reductase [NADPH] flavoprotein alpha-component [Nosema granulosis]